VPLLRRVLVEKSVRLDERDTGQGDEGAQSLIGALAARLQVAYDRMGESGEGDAAADG
jgi:hypothetical protein